MSALLETNPSESFEYFKDLNIISVLTGVVFLSLGIYTQRWFPKLKNKRLVSVLLITFVLLSCSKPIRTIIKRDISSNYVSVFFSNFRYSPMTFIYDWYDSYEKYYSCDW